MAPRQRSNFRPSLEIPINLSPLLDTVRRNAGSYSLLEGDDGGVPDQISYISVILECIDSSVGTEIPEACQELFPSINVRPIRNIMTTSGCTILRAPLPVS